MIYSGPIEAGQMHGRGRITYANSETYDGDIHYGKRQGRGVYTYLDGGRYEGEWFDDKPHGQGRCTYSNGMRMVRKMGGLRKLIYFVFIFFLVIVVFQTICI
jgi:hypothetical protein